MIALILPLATEALRLANTLLEGVPVEQRRAQALAWWAMTWPLVRPFVPAEVRDKIEALMREAQ